MADDLAAGGHAGRTAERSANAFSYYAESGEEPALALAVDEQDAWFYSDYSVEAAARHLGTGAMGLVLYAQDEDNYIAFRWTSQWSEAADRALAQLVEVRNGERTVIAERPGGFIPEQWYAVRAAICEGVVQCWVDDVLMVAGRSDLFGQGRAGLYAEGGDGTYFDDVLIQSWDSFRDNFEGEPDRWRIVCGQWEHTPEGQMKIAGGGEALLVAGRTAWRNYAYAADVKLASGGAGIVVAHQPDAGAVVVRVAAPGSGKSYAGKLQVVRLGDTETVLEEATVELQPGGSYRLKATVEEGLVQAYVDDALVAQALDLQATTGSIGLYGDDGPGTAFDNAFVRFSEPKRTAHVPQEMADTSEHPEMREWASDRAAWVVPQSSGPGTVYWTKGDYYGDLALELPLRSIGAREATTTAVLGGSPQNPEAGIVLQITATRGTRALRLEILRAGEQLTATDVTVEAARADVRFERKGPFVVVYVDDEPVLSHRL